MIGEGKGNLYRVIPILALMFASCAPNLSAQSVNVAVMGIGSTPAWNTDVQHKLMSTGLFRLVDVFDVSADSIPMLPNLQRYQAILVYGVTEVPTETADRIGDLLASYFESGGGVVDMVALQGQPLGGRWRSSGYPLLSPAVSLAGERLTLGSVTANTVLKDVTTFDGGLASSHSLGQPVDGTNVVAVWSNNSPLIILGTARGFPRVTLNFFPVSSDSRDDFWDAQILPDAPAVPDGARLMANALVAVVQSPPPPESCTVTIAPPSITVGAKLFVELIAVSTSDPGCHYMATSDAPWATPIPRIAQKDDLAALVVDENAGAARTTTIHLANSDLVVNQTAGDTPVFSLSPDLALVDSNLAFNDMVTVTAPDPSLNWTAVSDAPWIHITSPTQQTGNGTVSYSLDQNTGLRRTSTMTIAGLTYVVIQGGASCSFTLNSAKATVSADGDSVTVDVTTPSNGCPWTAVSESEFVTVTSDSQGTGDGSVSFSIAPNPSANPRVGKLRIGLQTLTVTQMGAAAVVSIAVGGPGSVL